MSLTNIFFTNIHKLESELYTIQISMYFLFVSFSLVSLISLDLSLSNFGGSSISRIQFIPRIVPKDMVSLSRS